MIISCKDIQKFFGADDVLKNVSFLLEEKEKAALVGVNGAGKTTLFKIILGQIPSDGGEIVVKKGAKMAYLAQNMDLDFSNTIHDELLSVFAHLEAMEAEIRVTEAHMASAAGVELDRLMDKYTKLTRDFEGLRGYEYKSRVRGVLAGLGFNEAELALEIAKLSGGQKTRVCLGKLLLSEPDLLLLDEPTNHLDIAAITWLEDYFLREYEKAVIIISHDRYFLDKVAKKVIELEHGVAKTYGGNYSYFVEKKAADFEIAAHQYAGQQKEIKRQEASIALLRSFNREKFVRRARSKEKQLAKIERLDKPQAVPSRMRLALSPRVVSGNDVVTVRQAKKIFEDGQVLFSGVDLDIKRGEKVALIGENGVGKTTLFNMVRYGDSAVNLGTNVKIGYYDQELRFDNLGKTIFQEIADAYPRLKNLEIRHALAALLFVGDEVDKSLAALSGGERGRVALCKLMLSDVNFLMLDEPTNHLDLFSKEILENVLIDYEGTVLYISHDRYFINNTAEKIYELEKFGATLYLGNYDYYTEKRSEKREIGGEKQEPLAGEAKGDWLDRKEDASRQRKQRARIERIEAEIEETEAKISLAQTELEKEEVATDPTQAQEVYFMQAALEERLNGLLAQWEQEQQDK